MNVKKYLIKIAVTILLTTTVNAEQINVSITGGKSFNKSILGVTRAFEDHRELANEGVSVRGVSPGLFADTYNWKSNTGVQRGPVTFPYLVESRDNGSELIFTANMVGTGPTAAWFSFIWTNTDINLLKTLAADWVRYTNFIVPNYRQGDTLDASDQAIINQITWSPKLAAAGEAATPKVSYWEIGNEILIYDKATFNSRYKTIADAMLAVDNTIKVGPAIILVSPSETNAPVRGALQDPSTRVDFISYHPYHPALGNPSVWSNESQLEQNLRDVSPYQRARFADVYNTVVADRGAGAANAMEYIASEWNVAGFNYFHQQRSVANALGAADTVFTFADLGLRMANYWMEMYDSYHGNYPVAKVLQAMAKYMGDTLVSVYPAPITHANSNHRLYVCQDSSSNMFSVWAINFSNSQPWDVTLNISNAPAGNKATLMTLGGLQQETSLTTLHNPGVSEVIWDVQNLSELNLGNIMLNVPAASITALVWDSETIEFPVPPITAVDANDIVSYAVNSDIYDNQWSACEVSGSKVGTLAEYKPMQYDIANGYWKGSSVNPAKFSAVLSLARVVNSAVLESYTESASVSSIGALMYSPRMDERINLSGSLTFNDIDGTSGGMLIVRRFDRNGNSAIIKSLSMADNASISLDTISQLQNIDIAFGDKIVFEVSGNTVGHRVAVDFTAMRVVNTTCWHKIGDVNNDCYIDLNDFSQIANKWLQD